MTKQQLLFTYLRSRNGWDASNTDDVIHAAAAHKIIMQANADNAPRTLYDVATIYDNVAINSEIITADNVDEYGDFELMQLTGRKRSTLRDGFASGLVWLCNFFDLSGRLHYVKSAVDVNGFKYLLDKQ